MKAVLLILTFLSLTGCMMNYPVTTFYVKNTTDKTLNFKAGVIKQTSMGPYEMTLPFSVPPNDSLVARKVGFKKDAPPTAWFTDFIIFPADSVSFNDPNNSNNWIKATDQNGRPIYIFNMVE